MNPRPPDLELGVVEPDDPPLPPQAAPSPIAPPQAGGGQTLFGGAWPDGGTGTLARQTGQHCSDEPS